MNDKEVEKEQCHEAANMIVDALIDAKIIREKDSSKAIEIAEEELLVRKAIQKI